MRTFGPETGSNRRMQKIGLYFGQLSPDVSRVMKSPRTRRAGLVDRMGDIRIAYIILVRKSQVRVLGRLRRFTISERTGFIWLRIGSSVVLL
jgi:hypothetical protein